ncbi:SDR family oxidoreductase [Fusobacterium nucleatum]|nr:SDR family oxidoreductase [Fusobacterium nucleatum]WDF25222.1 SDR family oxidoreductase [Fusobacterium nucleatum]
MEKSIVFPPNTKFLVTGGAGFIGSNIVEKILELNYKVRVLDNFSTGKKENIENFLQNSNFELIEGDIRDIEVCKKACQGIDYVLHQAAWGSVPRSIEMPLIYEEINIKGHLNMMEAARENRIKKFVYASSSSVYGDSTILPKKEGVEGKVLSPYALTKKVNEEYAKLYFNLYGLDTIGMRYFNVFGKKQNPDGFYAAVIPKFVKQLINNERPQINGDGETSRDFTYVDNVVEANLKACLANKSASGEAFNIAYGGRETLNNLYRKLSQLLSKEIEPIYKEERKGDIKHSNADISKAREFLKYEPKYSMDRGLELTIEWYKNNL